MSTPRGSAPLKLPFWGQARLEYRGKPVKLRRKGLALLYYLALEGPTRREVLADLLWGHNAASQNLRVELHRLRQALMPLGFNLFASGEDPLRLPDYIEIDRTPSEGLPLEGLDDLSPEFQQWLEVRREIIASVSAEFATRQDLVRELAGQVRPPYLIILEGGPGAEHQAFAQALARELGLPYREGDQGRGKVLHYLRPPYPGTLPAQALNDREGVWVVERSSYGEDPRVVLQLRETWPPDRVRYVVLPPLTWNEAFGSLLRGLPFSEAARLYLATAGNPGYLRELLALRPSEGFGAELPVPQRVRAAFQLETRYLSLEARLTLERLSVHPGFLDDGLLEVFGARAHLEELERRGWLVFDRKWRFADETARRVIYASLQQGRHQRYHRTAAEYFAMEGHRLAEAYHLLRAGEQVDWEALLPGLPEWAQVTLEAWLGFEPEGESLPRAAFRVGQELALLEASRFGEGFEVQGAHCTWVRMPGREAPSGAEWQLPEEPCLLRIRGRGYQENTLGVGLSGKAVPLEVRVMGERPAHVLFAGVRSARWLGDGTLLLPVHEAMDYWLFLPQSRSLRVQSLSEAGLFELELSVYRAKAFGPGRAPNVVEAYDLRDQPVLDS